MNNPLLDKFQFSKKKDAELFNCLNIQGPAAEERSPLRGLSYNSQLDFYLALVDFLSQSLDKYVIVKITPYLNSIPELGQRSDYHWLYQFEANDISGIGVDNGFINIKRTGEPHSIIRFCSLSVMRQLPEDNLGEKESHLSFFGLAQTAGNRLKKLIQQENPPQLKNFLQGNEVFIDMTVSKAEEFLHTMLIKSPADIEQRLRLF